MAIAPELRARILRLYEVERWRVGTIARQLRVHHHTVRKVLVHAGVVRTNLAPRPSQADAYLPFLLDTLGKFPTLTASRLHGMVRERGYRGGADYFRHFLARHRPRPAAEAYLRLRTLPGEQAQVDWAHCGHMMVGRAKRPLMAFVMVLSYSRRIFLRFSLNARMDSFQRGHVLAMQLWGGVPRVILSDNLKSAVLERVGDAIRFNPQMLAFAAHYRYEPRPVAVARGNEKGRVEKSIRYIRDAFLAARPIEGIDQLNAQALDWCASEAATRRWPQDDQLTVQQAFEQERPSLMALPTHAWDLGEQLAVAVGKTPYARFDLNDYSVPSTHVQRTVTIVADPERVRILDGVTVLATHARSYDRGMQIEQPCHIEELVVRKRGARQHRATDRLTKAAPAIAELLLRAARRGDNLGSITAELSRLLDRYGTQPLQAAVLEALARDVPHPNAVRLALERAREQRQQLPPVATQLSERARAMDVTVRHHGLDTYDALRPHSTPDTDKDEE